MIDGTTIEYVVDLIYVDPVDGEVFRQGITLLRTEHLCVAEQVASSRTYLAMAKRIHKRRGPEYALRIQSKRRVVATEYVTVPL